MKRGETLRGNGSLSMRKSRVFSNRRRAWKAGRYRLKIESRLEDLAGNNLNRPFDRDITRKNIAPTTLPFVEILFNVK